jgi:hypothetical protein
MARSILTDFDFGNVSKIQNLPTPTQNGDAANKAYVDSLVEGLAWKDSCRVSTQGNINLASPGATIDGVTMVAGDRVLVRLQTAGADNGIYVWNGSSTPMTRALDASTAAELEQAVVVIEEGTSAGLSYRQTVVNATLGTTELIWGAFGSVSPAATESTPGIAEIATQAETDAGTDDQRIVTPAKLAGWSGRTRRFAANIGDGSATSYTVTHNLGSRDVAVSVYRNSGNYDEILCDVERSTTNAVVVKFSAAPTSNQFRVVIVG